MYPTRIPGIEYGSMPRAGTRAADLPLPPRLVVIHDTGNNTSNARGEASFAATRTDASTRWTSAHAYFDPDRVVGSLPLNLQAWAAYGYANGHGFHLEMCRTVAGVAPATIARITAVVRWLCQTFGIPMVKLTPAQVAAGRSGICGHYDITTGLHVGDHIDPGPNFDWTAFMAQVLNGEDEDMGASFGPVQIERGGDATTLVIPPVEAGLADPRQTWLNIGADTNGPQHGIRVWATNGDGHWFPINPDGKHADGLYVLSSGVVLSLQLPQYVRLLSVSRFAPAGGELFAGSVSACFERK